MFQQQCILNCTYKDNIIKFWINHIVHIVQTICSTFLFKWKKSTTPCLIKTLISQLVQIFPTVLKPDAPISKIINVSNVMVRSKTSSIGQPTPEDQAMAHVAKVSGLWKRGIEIKYSIENTSYKITIILLARLNAWQSINMYKYMLLYFTNTRGVFLEER